MPCEQLQPTCVAQSGLKQTICVYDPLTGTEIKAIHTYDITAQCSTINETFTRLDGSALPAGYQLRACVPEVAIVRQNGTTTVVGTVTVTGVSTAANQATQITSLSSIDGKLTKATVGAAIPSTGSFSLGSDGTLARALLTDAAGRQLIATRTSAVAVAPAVSAAAYAAGNVVGGKLTFTNAFDTALSGVFQNFRVTSKSVQTTSYKLYLFNADPSSSTFTDKTAPAINVADVPKLIGVYPTTLNDSGLGTHAVSVSGAISDAIVSATTSLFGVLVCTGTPTFASTSDITVSVGILKD